MKNQLRAGVVIGFLLLLATPIFADPIRETQALRARLSLTDDRNNAEILAFTSTSAANNAANLMQSPGNTLSFSGFGRVPFHQILTVSHNVTAHPNTTASTLSASSVPEPTTLLLLGSGLTALAVGLRKRNQK